MKKPYLIAGITALTVVAATLSVSAHQRAMGPGGPGGPGMMERPTFAELDADGDGQVTTAEMDAYGKARFDEADTDGNGTLSAEEMAARVEQKMHERMAQGAAERLRVMDEDGDGALSYDEMAGARSGRMFRRIDADGDGSISADEYAAVEEMRGPRGGGMMRKRHGH